jgi:hypothetical protein
MKTYKRIIHGNVCWVLTVIHAEYWVLRCDILRFILQNSVTIRRPGEHAKVQMYSASRVVLS